MQNPLVSIIIPVYNGEKYLQEAVDSALSQTYQNIEIIIVNDGSIDSTDEIAKTYQTNHPDKIRYYKKENGGCASALNQGIAKMQGEYFSWLSHDDVYLSNKIEHQIQIIESLKDKNTIIYCGYHLIDKNSKYISSIKPHDVLNKDKIDKSLAPLLRGLIHGCALLIPKVYFEQFGAFNEQLLSTQDYDLWFKILRQAPIKYTPEILIKSRTHPEQGTHKISNHIEECNELWTGFLRELTEDEMIDLEGSEVKFLQKTANFLANTPYKKAHQYAKEQQTKIIQNTKVSIIIPFYNRIEWTIEAIKSAQRQTHQNIEILLINDGSTEDISKIIELCSIDDRIKLFEQENQGQGVARNHAIKKSTGNYIAFLDSDDLFEPQKIELQLEFMQKKGYEISHTSYNRIDENDNFLNFCDSGAMSGIVFPEIISCCRIALPTVMVLSSVLKEYSFPLNCFIAEDVCLWIKLCAKYELGGIDKPLTLIRVTEQTSAIDNDKSTLGILNIATFCMKDANFSKYKHQIAKLLAAAVGQLSTPENYVDTYLVKKSQKKEEDNYPKNILQKIILVLKKEGVRGGLNKIKLKLKTHLYS